MKNLREYIDWLKRTVTDEMFRNVVNAADDDIKFNRVRFGKTTSSEQYVVICKQCHTALLKC